MRIIDERDKRNRQRRRMKDQYDSVMTLKVNLGEESTWYPLLQEGMVTYADGSPQFYLMKGTVRGFYDSLDPSYVGSINVGHTDLATFPERIVGQWTKDNLRVRDIENGRQVLETDLPINYEHPIIKALAMAPYDVGLSVEMGMHINEELSRSEDKNPFGVPLVDAVDIYDYAIVGNAGDVNSMGVILKGELPKMDERLKKLAALLDDEGTTSLADVTKLLEDSLGEAEDLSAQESEEKTEEKAEETEDLAEASEETVEASAEEAEEVAEEAAEEAQTDDSEVTEASAEENVEVDTSAFDDILAQISALKEELEAVKAQLAEKDETLAAKDAELETAKANLAAKEAEEKAFMSKFKNLSIALTKEVKESEAPKSQYTDGIGE